MIVFLFAISATNIAQAYDGCGINRGADYEKCLKIVNEIEEYLKQIVKNGELNILKDDPVCDEFCKKQVSEFTRAVLENLEFDVGDMSIWKILKSLKKTTVWELLMPVVLEEYPEDWAQYIGAKPNEVVSSQRVESFEDHLGYHEDMTRVQSDEQGGKIISIEIGGAAGGIIGLAAKITAGTTIAIGATTTSGSLGVAAGATFACGPVCWAIAGALAGGIGLTVLYNLVYDETSSELSASMFPDKPAHRLVLSNHGVYPHGQKVAPIPL